MADIVRARRSQITRIVISEQTASQGDFVKAVDDSDDVTEGVSHLFLTSAERTKIAAGGTHVDNELVSGSANTFTLAFTPIAGSVHVYGAGGRLTLTTDYSISGAVITTINSFNAGDIVADYRK